MKKFKILIMAAILIITGFLLYPTGVLSTPKNILFRALKPFSIVSNYTVDKVVTIFGNFANLNSLGKENQKLIKENLELQGQIAIIKEVQHENEILKKEIGFLNTKSDLKLMPANIVGRSISGYLKTIVIDRGEKDGIKQNQAIISQGFLVGTVRQVFPNSAEVILITDNNSLVPVVLQDSRGTGMLRGGFGGLTVEDIPLNIPIKKGEQVVTSGLGGDVPLGIMVGTVEDVISHEGEIFQKVTVKSPIQIYFLEFVFVASQ
ncbi:MAG: rod shape-determining protein MreC [Patescibacteria group bacterium]|nr:rod shape-determining protein MreC [Patescibacteria group bacterium]